ncbi:MAG: hypothetical protein WBO95_17665 [Candidatus Dechloromonas phosphoritropha]
MQITLHSIDGRLQFLDRTVLDGLIAKGDAAFTFGECRLEGTQLIFVVRHQRYTTRFISVVSASFVLLVAQRTST